MNNDSPAAGSRRGSTARASTTRRSTPRPARLPWGWILLALVVAGGVAAFFGARPAWRKVKAIRAMRFVAEAKAAFDKENWTVGFERTRAALQLSPINPDVLRHAAYAFSRVGSESGFIYFDALFTHAKATVADREEYANLALRVGNLELARQVTDELLESPNPTARTLVLGSQMAYTRRDLTSALRLAREASRLEPANPTNRFAVASMLAFSRRPADRQEGREILWPFARTNGPLQARALTALLTGTEAPRTDREEVEKILTALPKRTLEQDFLLADARVSLDPSRRSKIADELIELHGRGPTEEIVQTARWLNRHQVYHRTRDILLPDAARKDITLFRLRHEALMGLDSAREAYDFIMEDNAPGDPLQVEFLRCATALKLKNQAAIDSHYRTLVKLAQKSTRSLRAVAEFAFRNGNRTISNEIFQLLMRNPRDAATALRGLVRNADALGETWAARDYARKLASLRKDEDPVRLQIAYYDLLLKENLEKAHAEALALHQAKPEDINRRIVLALSHLRRNEPAKANALLEGQVVTWARMLPGMRAVVAATLGAGGKINAAASAIRRLPISSLKPEERELIRPYMSGLPVDESAEGRDDADKPEKL